uniref:BACK domain-containing protein n=1 Tax=Ascaris lumbricoides TaxID=6252 RepID=A0A9J2PB72_ASCLU
MTPASCRIVKLRSVVHKWRAVGGQMTVSKDLDIRSETQVALTDDMTERVLRSPNIEQRKTVTLRTRRRNYPIKIENFARHSEKIKKLLQNNEVPPAIDLSCYNVGAVRTLTDFLAGVDARNLRLGASILPDLLQLARIFRMHELTDLIAKHVLEKVESGSTSSLLLALHLVANDWSLFLNTECACALLEAAAENIADVTSSTFFNILPAAVLVMLVSRCDVNLPSELDLCLLLVRWLKAASRTDEEAEILFSCVRTPFLSTKDREILKEKTVGLPRSMVSVIERTLDSPRNHRCCVIRSHIERRYPRCGVPDSPLYARHQQINVTAKVQETKNEQRNKLDALKKEMSDLKTARAKTSTCSIDEKGSTKLCTKCRRDEGGSECDVQERKCRKCRAPFHLRKRLQAQCRRRGEGKHSSRQGKNIGITLTSSMHMSD